MSWCRNVPGVFIEQESQHVIESERAGDDSEKWWSRKGRANQRMEPGQ